MRRALLTRLRVSFLQKGLEIRLAEEEEVLRGGIVAGRDVVSPIRVKTAIGEEEELMISTSCSSRLADEGLE